MIKFMCLDIVQNQVCPLAHLVSRRLKRLDDCAPRFRTLSEATRVAKLRVLWSDLLPADSLPEPCQPYSVYDLKLLPDEFACTVRGGVDPLSFYVTGLYTVRGFEKHGLQISFVVYTTDFDLRAHSIPTLPAKDPLVYIYLDAVDHAGR